MIPLLRQTALRCPTIPVMISADAPDDSAVRPAFTGRRCATAGFRNLTWLHQNVSWFLRSTLYSKRKRACDALALSALLYSAHVHES